MNTFSIIGKCKKIHKIGANKFIINVICNSRSDSLFTIPIHVANSNFISKIRENDLLGINGIIDIHCMNIIFIASKVIWLPEK